MAKLYFKYGVMNSGKSLFLLALAHNFSDRGIKHIIMKPSLDVRDKSIKSRALNKEVPCDLIDVETNIYDYFLLEYHDCRVDWILVDEAQFLSEKQVDQLAQIVDEFNINVICYGLRTDFQTKLFPGSKRLFEIADSFEEMKSTCSCGNRASVNARLDEHGFIQLSGNQVECGAEDKYITLCRKCYKKACKKKTHYTEL